MPEFIGLAYFAEIPVGASSTCSAAAPRPACRRARSSPTCSSCAYASHGDTKHVLLLPRGPDTSASSSRAQAFDLADRLQTPVFVMTDLDIGMNERLCEPLDVGRRARATTAAR